MKSNCGTGYWTTDVVLTDITSKVPGVTIEASDKSLRTRGLVLYSAADSLVRGDLLGDDCQECQDWVVHPYL
jgi:hypothetical protein